MQPCYKVPRAPEPATSAIEPLAGRRHRGSRVTGKARAGAPQRSRTGGGRHAHHHGERALRGATSTDLSSSRLPPAPHLRAASPPTSGTSRANAPPPSRPPPPSGCSLAIGATGRPALHPRPRVGPALLLGVISRSPTPSLNPLRLPPASPSPRASPSTSWRARPLQRQDRPPVMYSAVVVRSSRAAPPATVPALAARAVLATVGGLAVGLAMGLGVAFVIRRTVGPLAEIMAPSALACASYTAAGLRLRASSPSSPQGSPSAPRSATDRRAAEPRRDQLLLGVRRLRGQHLPRASRWASRRTRARSRASTDRRRRRVRLRRARRRDLPPFLALRLARPAPGHCPSAGSASSCSATSARALHRPRARPAAVDAVARLLVDAAFGVTFVSLVAQG